MTITFSVAPRVFETAQIVPELPEVGKSFHVGLLQAAEVRALEPWPYKVPQDRPENYLYSVWRVTYRPDNLVNDAHAFVAIHEAEAEKI